MGTGQLEEGPWQELPGRDTSWELGGLGVPDDSEEEELGLSNVWRPFLWGARKCQRPETEEMGQVGETQQPTNQQHWLHSLQALADTSVPGLLMSPPPWSSHPHWTSATLT